ncbi:MAG: PIN domain-containing protein [Gammaproteobacteria bacterium]
MTSERWFFDTNILVYVYDESAPSKQIQAKALWKKAINTHTPVISTQVLQEFLVTATRARKLAMHIDEARFATQQFAKLATVELIDPTLIFDAIRRMKSSGFSFWDSLIVESALATGASMLWTEDLQHGQKIGSLTVSNPFV